jgi:hypothetical protein
MGGTAPARAVQPSGDHADAEPINRPEAARPHIVEPALPRQIESSLLSPLSSGAPDSARKPAEPP